LLSLSVEPHVSQEFTVKCPDKASFGKNSSGKYTAREFKTAEAVFSMWSYFLEFNVKLQERAELVEERKNQLEVVQSNLLASINHYSGSFQQQQLRQPQQPQQPRTPTSVLEADWSPGLHDDDGEDTWDNDPYEKINKHTGRRRLPIFVKLSQSRSI